jgi:heat shock protein HslJ
VGWAGILTPNEGKLMKADSMGTRRKLRWRWLGAFLVGLIALAGCIPPGAHTVSSFGAGGISPGLYRTLGGAPAGNPCVWIRGDASGHLIAFDVSTGGPRYAQVLSTDASFFQANCVTFWLQPSVFSKALHNPADPLAPFGPGDWLVGFEVAPGWYAAPGASSGTCSWERVSSFQHVSGDIIANQSTSGKIPQLLQISSGDYGFTSDGCGSWQQRTFVPPAQAALTGTWHAITVKATGSSAPITVSPKADITANFAAPNLTGMNNCNSYSALFAANSGNLAIGSFSQAATCTSPDPASAAYAAALPNAFAYTLSGSTLTLLDANGATLIVYGP